MCFEWLLYLRGGVASVVTGRKINPLNGEPWFRESLEHRFSLAIGKSLKITCAPFSIWGSL